MCKFQYVLLVYSNWRVSLACAYFILRTLFRDDAVVDSGSENFFDCLLVYFCRGLDLEAFEVYVLLLSQVPKLVTRSGKFWLNDSFLLCNYCLFFDFFWSDIFCSCDVMKRSDLSSLTKHLWRIIFCFLIYLLTQVLELWVQNPGLRFFIY